MTLKRRRFFGFGFREDIGVALAEAIMPSNDDPVIQVEKFAGVCRRGSAGGTVVLLNGDWGIQVSGS